MNAFDAAKMVEARSIAALGPFLDDLQGRWVLTNKGVLGRFLQETAGDILFNDRTGGVWGVELKSERRCTGNLFLEVWSNRNLEDRARHAGRGSNVGWLQKIGADLLFYHFVDDDKLYILNVFALKRWAFCEDSRNRSEPVFSGQSEKLPGRIWDFPERHQKAYDQLNDTRGRIVPVGVLQRELSVKPVCLPVRQLRLDLLGEDAA